MVSSRRMNIKHPGIKPVVKHGLQYLCTIFSDSQYQISHQLFCFELPFSILLLIFLLLVNVEGHISNQILSCGKLNMYKSAKGEIQPCQGRFSAYRVSGKTPLIHKGCVEGANKVCVRLCVITRNIWLQTVSSIEASTDPSVFPMLKDHNKKIAGIYFVLKGSI